MSIHQHEETRSNEYTDVREYIVLLYESQLISQADYIINKQHDKYLQCNTT